MKSRESHIREKQVSLLPQLVRNVCVQVFVQESVLIALTNTSESAKRGKDTMSVLPADDRQMN